MLGVQRAVLESMSCECYAVVKKEMLKPVLGKAATNKETRRPAEGHPQQHQFFQHCHRRARRHPDFQYLCRAHAGLRCQRGPQPCIAGGHCRSGRDERSCQCTQCGIENIGQTGDLSRRLCCCSRAQRSEMSLPTIITDLVAGETTDQTTDNGAYTSTGSGSGSRTVTLITGGAAAAGAAAVPAAGGCEQAAMLISISASSSEDLWLMRLDRCIADSPCHTPRPHCGCRCDRSVRPDHSRLPAPSSMHNLMK